MATPTRYAKIKKWAQATDKRSIQLWMPKDAIRLLDQLCRERKVGRAALICIPSVIHSNAFAVLPQRPQVCARGRG